LGRQLRALGREALVEELGGEDAIDAEIAEVIAQLAPGSEQGHIDIVTHRDRADGPVGALARLVHVGNCHLAGFVDRSSQCGWIDAGGSWCTAVRNINRRGGKLRLQRLRHHCGELCEHALRRPLQFRIAQPPQQAHPDRNRVGFFGREHQGRKIKAAPQHITEPRRALDRHTAPLQGSDVAVHRAHRHFELAGKRGCGYRPRRCTQLLNDVEQAVGPAHCPVLNADRTLSVCRC